MPGVGKFCEIFYNDNLYKRHRNSEQIMRKCIIYIEFCNFSMIGNGFFILKLFKKNIRVHNGH